MADIKNFGLVGVGPDLQLGKAGPRLKVNGSAVEARSSDELSLVTLRAAVAVANTDVVVLSQLNAEVSFLSNAISNATVADGFGIVLGNATAHGDSWTPGAVVLTDTVKVSDAVEKLNMVLGKLVPTSPPNFPNGQSYTVTSVGSQPVLASGVADNAGSGIAAGTSITRITGNLSSSNVISLVGPGDSGTLSLFINNTLVEAHTLSGTGDNGTYNGLTIAGQASYPASTPGFWTSVNVSVSAATISNTGVNSFHVSDSAAGTTSTVYIVKDSLTASPAVTLGTLTQNAAGTMAYSSSVPHYGTSGVLSVAGSISNYAGQAYYNGNPLTISPTGNVTFSSQSYSYANLGVTTPIAQNTTAATAITPVSLSLNATNTHTAGQATLTATNVNGTGAQTPSTIILLKNGTATAAQVDEMSIPVSGLGSVPNTSNALRVGMATGNTPALTANAWVETAALNAWDAAVVGGVLSANQTNYTTGYLPAGPNLSGRSSTQYVTFAFERSAVSQFNVVVTGTYAGCWVALPGVSDNATISPDFLGGGWWNAFAIYNGAGVPGRAGDTPAGCAASSVMTGASGTFTLTFGTQSSTNSTSNLIYVRFALNAGQSITALSFT
jgi:hypothetical protein